MSSRIDRYLETGIEIPPLETDYYTDSRTRQPKAEIANYVESCGIPVPRRFATLDEALESGKPFVIRSEHPQDYDGSSGLLVSLNVTQELIERVRKEHGSEPRRITYGGDARDRWAARDQTIAMIGEATQKRIEDNINSHCRLIGADPNQFVSDISYS